MLLHAEYCTKQFDCLICHWKCVNCAVLLFGFPRSSLPPLLRSIVVIDQSISNLLHIQPFSQPIPFIPLLLLPSLSVSQLSLSCISLHLGPLLNPPYLSSHIYLPKLASRLSLCLRLCLLLLFCLYLFVPLLVTFTNPSLLLHPFLFSSSNISMVRRLFSFA